MTILVILFLCMHYLNYVSNAEPLSASNASSSSSDGSKVRVAYQVMLAIIQSITLLGFVVFYSLKDLLS